jgi:hypothetical protein
MIKVPILAQKYRYFFCDWQEFIEKVTKTVVFGLDKVQERLGTNNQF